MKLIRVLMLMQLKLLHIGLQAARAQNPEMSIIIITHYPRLLSFITPDMVHIMNKGSHHTIRAAVTCI